MKMKHLTKILLLAGFLLTTMLVQALPPNYTSFDREQKTDLSPDPNRLIRIWMIYVGQGDAILIQIPGELAGTDETLEILVDGGAFNRGDQNRARDFILDLYGENDPVIEHTVISHHDSDHVDGLGPILREDRIQIETIWHNGLASYRANQLGLTAKALKNTINIKKKKKIDRVMAELLSDGKTLKSSYLIDSKSQLRTALGKGKLHGVYKRLAHAVVNQSKPGPVNAFSRAHHGSPFINVSNPSIDFKLLWPLEGPQKYGNWGETINGNSVTFAFEYKNFQMLFTGDHNQKSEPAMIKYLKQKGLLDQLETDVLKVPHHGSSHAAKAFFKHPSMNPVLGIASMGKQGFETNWKHPAEKVITYLGGAHRVYSTYIHEKRFAYEDLTPEKKANMRELSHVLIETDGEWFRVVEVPVDQPLSLDAIPTVLDTQRSNGTRWIKAS